MLYKVIIVFLSITSSLTACSEPSTVPTNSYSPVENSSPSFAKKGMSFNEFCQRHEGTFLAAPGSNSVCMGKNASCNEMQYRGDACFNFDRCVSTPQDCNRFSPPIAPNFCLGGSTISMRDACGCYQGAVCDKSQSLSK